MPRGIPIDPKLITEAIRLRQEEGLTAPEISTITGISEASLSKYLAPYPLSAARKLEGMRKGALKASATRYDRVDRFVHPLPRLEALRDTLGMREREQLNQSIVCAHLDTLGIAYERLDSVTLYVQHPNGSYGMLLTRSATITARRFGHPEAKRGGGVRMAFAHLKCDWIAYVAVLVETGAIYCLDPALYHQQLLICRPDDHANWAQIGFPALKPDAPTTLARFSAALERHAPAIVEGFTASHAAVSRLIDRQEAIGVHNTLTTLRLPSRAKSERQTDVAARSGGSLPTIPAQPKLVRRRVPNGSPAAPRPRTVTSLAVALIKAADAATQAQRHA